MAKYSRMAKYEDLRKDLQNNTESQISSVDLDAFTHRLNSIDERATEGIEDTGSLGFSSATHAREVVTPKSEEPTIASFRKETPIESKKSDFATFDNEYLDEYINEAKQYGKEKGIVEDEDTQLNILEKLRGGVKPAKPYAGKDSLLDHPVQAKTVESTTDIPFIETPTPTIEDTRKNIAMQVEDYTTPHAVVDEEEMDDLEDDSTRMMDLDEYRAKENAAKIKDLDALISETTQLKVQLDEYNEDLNDVNDKVEHSNRVLNFVLILLIVALVVVLGVVVYWVMLAKGIIG